MSMCAPINEHVTSQIYRQRAAIVLTSKAVLANILNGYRDRSGGQLTPPWDNVIAVAVHAVKVSILLQ